MDNDVEMYNAYERALRYYKEFSTKKKEQVDLAEARLSNRDARDPAKVKLARRIGAQRWTTDQAAKTNIDDQKFAERQTLLHAAVLQVELLQEIRDLLLEVVQNSAKS